MADYESRTVNTKFSGLATSVIIFGVVGGVALLGFETLRQTRRTPKTFIPPFWSKDAKRRVGAAGGVYAKKNDKDIGASKSDAVGVRSKLTCEDWEMGHLYLARCFHSTNPSPPMSRWPLGWALQALKLDDWWYATHTGMDTVVYVRFLKAIFYWMLLQTLTTAPILLAVHLHFAKISEMGSRDLTDMSQASLSYLVTITVCPCNDTDPMCQNGRKVVDSAYQGANCTHEPNEQGRKLLWIHLVLLWFITFSWFVALYWIAKGSLRIRRRWVGELREKRSKASSGSAPASDTAVSDGRPAALLSSKDEQSTVGRSPAPVVDGQPANSPSGELLSAGAELAKAHSLEENEGWRQRTLLVTNLPPNMRDEASIRRYFEEFLRPDNASEELNSRGGTGHESSNASDEAHAHQLETSADGHADDGPVPTSPTAHEGVDSVPEVHPNWKLRSPVQTVVLVRKMNELSSMLSRRQEVLSQLEAAHIKLAQTVLVKVRKHARKMRGDETPPEEKKLEKDLDKITPMQLVRRLRRHVKRLPSDEKSDHRNSSLQEESKRMTQLLSYLAPFVSPYRCDTSSNPLDTGAPAQTVWEALHEIPRELLDPFQPVTRLSSLFRGQKVPTIDYLLTKLNLLTALVTEMRARAPTSYEATSTAFVTFRDPRQARMVWRELKSQIVVKVRLAPEVKDLDWERLMRTSFTGAIVRGFGVSSFFWFFTIIWTVPVNLLATSLFSVEKLQKPFPGLREFFQAHQQLEAFISVTLPTVIVSLLTMAVPELIFQISKRAQGFVTFSALYDQCLCRYWKFVICNVVIFFCLGSTTVESVVFQLGTTNNSLLNGIAFAFPTAAPFYISYMILGMALHTGFELVGFMIPLLQHFGARKAKTPRVRALKTLPRNFNRYYWLPFHTLIVSIVFLFALLNPLVIPFALVYGFVALTVFKKNFAYQYYRRFNEKEGVIYYIRLLRFSLDGLMVAQVVILVFFSVTRQETAYIALTAILLPITVAFKLLASRLWKSQSRAIEDDEANALCGIPNFADSVGTVSRTEDPEKGFATTRVQQPLDARANGRYPTLVMPPESSSRIVNIWNYVHNSFNANGHDSPSYFAEASARGGNVNAFTVTQAVASAPVSKVRNKATRGVMIAKAGVDINRAAPAGAFNARESLALSSFPNKDDAHGEADLTHDNLDGATARDLRGFLDKAEERQFGAKRSEHAMARRLYRKQRVSDAPYLSGFDSLANHAPTRDAEDDSEPSYADGEYEHLLSISRRQEAEEERQRARKRRAASEGLSNSLSQGYANDSFQTRREDDLDGERPTIVKDAHSASSLGDKDEEKVPLVKRHASVEWDDSPNNFAKYNNPFYSVELDPFLWFPRDPLMIIDLCDTIEWHGPAFVSSQGGSGLVGEWEDDMDEDEDQDSHCNASNDGNVSALGAGNASTLSQSASFSGREEIAITGALAKRIRDAEDLDENQDPAASLSRNQLDDYRRALAENDDVIAEEDEMEDNVERIPSPQTLHVPHRNESLRGRSPSKIGFGSTRRRMSASSSARLETGSLRHSSHSIKAHSPEIEKTQHEAQLQHSGHAVDGVSLRPTLRDRRSASHLSAGRRSHFSAHEAAPGAPAQPIAMRKALRAEVLQEEYIRTLKERAQRRRESTSEGARSLQRQSSVMSKNAAGLEGRPAGRMALSASPSHARFFSERLPPEAARSPKPTAAARFSTLVRAAQAQKKAEEESGDRALDENGPENGTSIRLQDVSSSSGPARVNESQSVKPTSTGADPHDHGVVGDEKGKMPAH